MMPPARIVQWISAQAAGVEALGEPARIGEAAHRLRQIAVGVAVAGERAEQRHEPVEPEREEGRERRSLRLGDLEDHEPPARLQYPRQLAQAAVEVGEVANSEADGYRVEGALVIGQLERVGPLEDGDRGGPRSAAGDALLAGQVEHPLREVGADHAAGIADAALQLEAQITGAAGDVEGGVAGDEGRLIDRSLTPAVVHAGGHRRVHQVVDPGDPVEHAADLSGEFL